jgi:KaiC/GvpD/RAD55 family RecA-like ATPase
MLKLKKLEDREDAERGLAKYKMLDTILIPQLLDFTIEALNQYSNEELLLEANKVASTVHQILRKKKLLDENTHQSFVDVLTSAALLHNIFYKKDDFTTLYIARKELDSLVKETGIPQQVSDTIFQTIEAQLGDDTPVPTSKPPVGSPTEVFAYAVWVVKEFTPEY